MGVLKMENNGINHTLNTINNNNYNKNNSNSNKELIKHVMVH